MGYNLFVHLVPYSTKKTPESTIKKMKTSYLAYFLFFAILYLQSSPTESQLFDDDDADIIRCGKRSCEDKTPLFRTTTTTKKPAYIVDVKYHKGKEIIDEVEDVTLATSTAENCCHVDHRDRCTPTFIFRRVLSLLSAMHCSVCTVQQPDVSKSSQNSRNVQKFTKRSQNCPKIHKNIPEMSKNSHENFRNVQKIPKNVQKCQKKSLNVEGMFSTVHLWLCYYYLTLLTGSVEVSQPTKSGSILKNVVNTPMGMSILLGLVQRLVLLHQFQPNADTRKSNHLLMILGKRLHEDHSDQEKFSVSVSPLNVELPNILFNNKDMESDSYKQLQKLVQAGLQQQEE